MNQLTEFWIDVGGTFTDCLMKSPDGRLSTYKVLSSGITKGRVTEVIGERQLRDEARIGDPAEFWVGYTLTVLDEEGAAAQSYRVTAFDTATRMFTLDVHLVPSPPSSGERARVRGPRGNDAFPLEQPSFSAPQPSTFDHQPSIESPPYPNPLPPKAGGEGTGACLALPSGMRYELSSSEEAPILAIRTALGLRLDEAIPPVSVRLGTTRGTNALLTRKGARTGFVTTKGFRDVLLIANQDRPRLFDLAIQKPEPLFAAVAEIDERLDAAGNVLLAPDEATVRERLLELKAAGCESLAICLLHAFANPIHEQVVERIARDVGFTEISTSSRLSPLIKIVSRGDTTVMDAYVNPILRDYVGKLRASLEGQGLRTEGQGTEDDVASVPARRAATVVPSPPPSGERARVRGPIGDDALPLERASSSAPQPSTIHYQPSAESPFTLTLSPPRRGARGPEQTPLSALPPFNLQPSTINRPSS